MRAPTTSSSGFALAELLVVIAILAVLLATVVAARPKASGTRVAVTARAVAETIRLARAQAMASNAETVVRIDTLAGRYGVPNSMHTLPRGMTIALTVAESERLGDSGGIRFYPSGQSSGGVVALMLDKRSAAISVNWLTGEPHVGSRTGP